MRGRNHIQIDNKLHQADKQVVSQAPDLLAMQVLRLHDRLAQTVDRSYQLDSKLVCNAGSGIGFSGRQPPYRRQWLTIRQASGDDRRVDALIDAGLGVALAPIARIHRDHMRKFISRRRDALYHGL